MALKFNIDCSIFRFVRSSLLTRLAAFYNQHTPPRKRGYFSVAFKVKDGKAADISHSIDVDGKLPEEVDHFIAAIGE